LLDAPQRPLSRERLLQATRIREDVFDRTIDVQVLRLRHKLKTDPNAPRVILTERGVGHVFAAARRSMLMTACRTPRQVNAGRIRRCAPLSISRTTEERAALQP
jgi:DNA-binding winged helix-turn-helix (wHTH) protein